MVGSLLVAGTTSDAGKSVVTTGLCRALSDRGLRVAPYKAQNMSNNSMVVGLGPGGTGAAQGRYGEIGRAQWSQALAARATPEVAMNPVLLKPGGERRSHVVVDGLPAGSVDAKDFVGGRDHLRAAAHAGFDDLARRYDVVIAEGAGSPAEINLRAGDYVNMGLARHAGAPTLLVGDIDRGGVFASFLGSTALLEAADQALIAGYVVNKFRGDPTLLRPGLDRIEELTGRRVFGVLPWSGSVWLDSEDALDLAGRRASGARPALRVAVVRLPRISNFTDVDALGLEPDLDVRFVDEPRDLAAADLVVLPGTRATLADLAWLRERGLDTAVVDHARAGRAVLGICGGYQMLGRTVVDPDGAEGRVGARAEGLGLLEVETVFETEKTLALPRGRAYGAEVGGYEIHHGRVEVSGGHSGAGWSIGARSGAVYGTLWHGSLEYDGFRRGWLAEVAADGGLAYAPGGPGFGEAREARLDLLGRMTEEYLDVDALLELIAAGAPAGLPFLPPGA